jgi:RNA polymerase sigma-70 factor (ECF subfamily)
MPRDASVQQQMLATIPNLRAFALSLTGDRDRADDLVQSALVKGLAHLEKFQPGTNMRAWLFTILRNQFLSEYRKRRREVEDPESRLAERTALFPEQEARLDVRDMQTALDKLPMEQREALLLVTAEGMTYEQAAQICGTHLGTIKSRVSRARVHLAELLSIDPAADLGPDRSVRAALLTTWSS